MNRWKVIANVLSHSGELVRMVPAFYVDASNKNIAEDTARTILHVPTHDSVQMEVRNVQAYF